jgi:hypothetical protein
MVSCGGSGSGNNFVPNPPPTPTPNPTPQVALTRLSTDTFTNLASQHASEVEPHGFAFGATIVTAFQVGRISPGGGAAIGFATSTNGGATWSNSSLPGLTTSFQNGPFSAASDAVVVYDAAHGIWMISSLAIAAADLVVVSRSHDGISWDSPITVSHTPNADKNWIVCDNTTTSPHYGNCYLEWDDPSTGALIWMSTSSDGGLTWSAAVNTADNATGLGGVPVVQPNGTVVVPIMTVGTQANPVQRQLAFRSTDGGASWSSTTVISAVSDHIISGNLRSLALPSAQVDNSGRVYVVWHDCRFRNGCSSNDIIMSTSNDGLTWSAPVRIPLDPTSSTVDHFLPAIGTDPTTGAATAHLSLLYYFYPVSNCTGSTCALNAAMVTSQDGGASWTVPTSLVSGMSLASLPSTVSGQMVGDYFASVFSGGRVFPIFTFANLPTNGRLDQAIYTTSQGQTVLASTRAFVSRPEQAIAGARSDHPPSGFNDLDHEHPTRPPRKMRRIARRK